MDNSSTDWAYLEKFRLENEYLRSYFDQNRVVFIGDSIIAGWKEQPLFRENLHFINRGINGQTSSQILHRFQPDVVDLKPKCVVVLVGTNDVAENQGTITLEEIQDNFLSMILLANSNDIIIILCSILPVSEYYWNKKINPCDKIVQLNQFLTAQSNNKTVFYTDLYSSLVGVKGMQHKFSEDGVHPNILGYQEMSKVLQRDLTRVNN